MRSCSQFNFMLVWSVFRRLVSSVVGPTAGRHPPETRKHISSSLIRRTYRKQDSFVRFVSFRLPLEVIALASYFRFLPETIFSFCNSPSWRWVDGCYATTATGLVVLLHWAGRFQFFFFNIDTKRAKFKQFLLSQTVHHLWGLQLFWSNF